MFQYSYCVSLTQSRVGLGTCLNLRLWHNAKYDIIVAASWLQQIRRHCCGGFPLTPDYIFHNFNCAGKKLYVLSVK
ncbi:hypothetical protein VFPPC_18101 [Pochonia chlamydosporia 170]|uniref:Uncharacterized protein n=1 Tax=Pochonia chlamydosporia 170 TaxID=1380566 RepID=A0A219APD2_METCM|nr:hypothetical protein VFPPC_18101 [Pochonia chlamydosporia 170]OWT42688.1 hypothetical protein VFPPC_18101 [Pochonia chlamydosporia 170]